MAKKDKEEIVEDIIIPDEEPEKVPVEESKEELPKDEPEVVISGVDAPKNE